jgi:hypothetical protein
MENKQQPVPGAPAQYTTQSRGYKTKGNQYKDRYVEIKCPEPNCSSQRAYKDAWKTRIKYTCLKRDCRHVWFHVIDIPAKNDTIEE